MFEQGIKLTIPFFNYLKPRRIRLSSASHTSHKRVIPSSNLPATSLVSISPIVPNNQQGFDEFMNLVLDDAEEVYIEKAGKEVKPRQDLGKWGADTWKCRERGGVYEQ
jgi:hypothetical protein